jgi:putative oxidoreductase
MNNTKGIIINIAAFSIFTLFVYTGVNKLISFDFTLKDLNRSPLLGNYALLIAILVPLLELLTAAMLMIPKYKKTGFLLAFFLMLTFTLYVGYVLSFTNQRPCTCGGIIRQLSWPNHLILNITFLILSTLGWLLHNRKLESNYA